MTNFDKKKVLQFNRQEKHDGWRYRLEKLTYYSELSTIYTWRKIGKKYK